MHTLAAQLASGDIITIQF